jgi:hypothetical protein
VDRDTPVSRTPTVAPGSPAHKRALLRERRAGGPRSCWALQRHASTVRSEDHVKKQRLRTRGAAAAGETKRRATLQSPRRQTVMMARRFTAERCANASIPTLRFDASTPNVPLNIASSRPPTLHLLPPVPLLPPRPKLMDPSASVAAAGSSSGKKHRGRPPGGGNKAKIPAQWTTGAGGPLRIGAPRWDEANRASSGTSGTLTLRGPAPGGAMNSPSPLVAAPAPRAPGSIDRVLWEVGAALGPLPPAVDPLARRRTEWLPLRATWRRRCWDPSSARGPAS